MGLSKIGVPMGEQGKGHGSPHGMAEYHWSRKASLQGNDSAQDAGAPALREEPLWEGREEAQSRVSQPNQGEEGVCRGESMVAARTGYTQGIDQISKYNILKIREPGFSLPKKQVTIIEWEKRRRDWLRIWDTGVNSWLSIQRNR